MSESAIEVVIVPRASDLGDGFTVLRALPAMQRRSVGPFVFLDQMGPVTLKPGRGMDVRPHPHIGLATVTYLFEGEIMHRDSLGTVLPIRPGDLNWMTAGRGIVHSERTPDALRPAGPSLYGMQAWVALPQEHEETAPSFVHHPATELPVIEGDGRRVRIIVGTLYGQRSPVHTLSETLYADVQLEAGALLSVPADYVERAIYLVEGSLDVAGEAGHSEAGRLLVLRSGEEVAVRAGPQGARLMLLGGAPLDGPRHLWWNFVSSSIDRIEQAKADWREGRFAPVPGETEFIPLPQKKA
jgi:redox-sensitive bicupin YhaK (pirin superfamily)